MVLSPAERVELVQRVRRLVTNRAVDVTVVRSAVDRVLATLATREPPADESRVVAVSAERMPDLASRLRGAVPGTVLRELAVASAGRHTVLVARVGAGEVDALSAAALGMGAQVAVRDRA